MQFDVPNVRYLDLRARLKKLAKRANKYDNAKIDFSFGEIFYKQVTDPNTGKKFSLPFRRVTVTGEAPKIEGYTLLARVELNAGKNLIHRVPGTKDLDERYRTAANVCEHCNQKRTRNDVYILEKDGKQISIGRTCLRDYLGIDDPKVITARAAFWESLFDEVREADDMNFGAMLDGGFLLEALMVLTAAATRKFGFVTRKQELQGGGVATATQIRDMTFADAIEADRDNAAKAIEWVRTLENVKSDFLYNLTVIFDKDVVEDRHVNLAVSAYKVWQDAMAKEAEVAAKENIFVGKVKERMKSIELTLRKVIYLGNSGYGPAYLHTFEDAKGNAFVWVTGNALEGVNETMVVDATVKAHKVYGNVNQTVLTRVSVKG